MTCNKDGILHTPELFYSKDEIWLSNEAINKLNALVGIGAGAYKIMQGLAAYVQLEASTPPGVGLILAGFLAVELSAINWFNRGCGVKITLWVPRTPPFTVAFQTMQSQ